MEGQIGNISSICRYKVSNDEPFDWEKAKGFKIVSLSLTFPPFTPSLQLKPSKNPAWFDADQFFASDPLKITDFNDGMKRDYEDYKTIADEMTKTTEKKTKEDKTKDH